MAASNLFKNPNIQTSSRPSKSCSSWVFKSVVIMLVLVVIPLFPSQAPDFINQSILTKFWELLHLLFIGIAVSYGLFCRRSVKIETESGNLSGFDYNDISHSNYLSGFFEDGFENLGGISDEKKVLLNLDSQYLYKDSIFKGSSATEGCKKIRSLTLRNGLESNRENVTEIWNSQYFQGESLVVVTDGNYDLEEHKPLGLPVRSLRSRVSGAGKLEFANRTLANSSLKRSFENDNEGIIEKIRGMRPNNLQNKFEEAVEPSKIPWKSSRSGRVEMREEVGNAEPRGHYRPHSVDEFEFKQLKSGSGRVEMREVGNGEPPGHSRPHSVEEFEFKQLKSRSERVEMIEEVGNGEPPGHSRPQEFEIKQLKSRFGRVEMREEVGNPEPHGRSMPHPVEEFEIKQLKSRSGRVEMREEVGNPEPHGRSMPHPVEEFEIKQLKSRSGRVEMREEVGNGEPLGHSRPHSVEEFEIKQLKSRSGRVEMREEDGNGEPLGHSRPHSVEEFEIKQLKSRSGRVEMREEDGNSERPGHSRPHSVRESESTRLKSRSFQQPASFSNSSNSLGSSSSSVSPEPSRLKTGNMEQEKELKFACDSKSHSTVANLNNGLSFTSTKAKGFSIIGSSSELDGQKHFEDEPEIFYRGVEQYLLGSGKLSSSDSISSDAKPSEPKPGNTEQKKDRKAACDSILHSTIASANNGLSFTSTKANKGFSILGSSSELDMQNSPEDDDSKDLSIVTKRRLSGRAKPSRDSCMSSNAKPSSNLSKLVSRAKSVRTIRKEKYHSNQIADDQVDEIQKQNPDKVHHPAMSSTLPPNKYENIEKQELTRSDSESEESTESENDDDSLDEKGNVRAAAVQVNDDEDVAGSEVDRKADEFIAKFRQQIRLQKIASARKHSAC